MGNVGKDVHARHAGSAYQARMEVYNELKRDHIWAYYTRNMVRPVALLRARVDVVIGNLLGSTTTRPSTSCARSWRT